MSFYKKMDKINNKTKKDQFNSFTTELQFFRFLKLVRKKPKMF